MPSTFCCTNGSGDKSSIKCVVWDLDNTLWQGTLLEGDSLVLTPGVRDLIQKLDNRGILQSVASKNDYDAAWAKLVEFDLNEYFLHPQINWVNKPDSLKLIADALGISLNTLAFIDDEAVERDEVHYVLPEVTTIDVANIDNLLDIPRLQPRFVTNESRIRRKMYQADIQRKHSENEFLGSKEDFLATLKMSMTIRSASELDLRRVEELTLRTNQLNTTGRSYSYEELQGLLNSPDHTILVAELDDRYGTSGTIGLSLIETRLGVWLVKLLITSCRVITRGVGGIMLSYILQRAKQRGVRLRAEFVANNHNRMMYVTYKFHGFYEIMEQDGVILLEHALESIRPFPRYVTVRSPRDE